MLLAIDTGNTQMVIGLFDGTDLADHWRIATVADRTADELALMIQQFLGFHGFPPFLVGRAREAEEPAGRGSGRVRHDEKITVYVSSDELMALEQARLTLRAQHGLRVDRGRLVREAIARLVSDLEENGADSEVVRRMTGP